LAGSGQALFQRRGREKKEPLKREERQCAVPVKTGIQIDVYKADSTLISFV
jgi:hypothetical protein